MYSDSQKSNIIRLSFFYVYWNSLFTYTAWNCTFISTDVIVQREITGAIWSPYLPLITWSSRTFCDGWGLSLLSWPWSPPLIVSCLVILATLMPRPWVAHFRGGCTKVILILTESTVLFLFIYFVCDVTLFIIIKLKKL